MALEKWVIHEIDRGPEVSEYYFFCPACGTGHGFRTKGPEPLWSFNGNMIKPTVGPSGSNGQGSIVVDWKYHCHLHVIDGMIHYLNDCTHSMAGKIVQMEEF